MTDVYRGSANTLLAEWRLYQGGPYSDVTGVQITITSLATNAVIVGATGVGITNPAIGINVYAWTPVPSLPTGSYLIQWTGTDFEAQTVGASEIVTVLAGGALGGPYADAATLKARMSIPDSDTRKDSDITSALSSASDSINRWCGRQFGQTSVASARSYAAGPSGVDVDDFWSLDDLTIGGTAYAEGGTYALLPTNGIVDGVPGWPYYRLARPRIGGGLWAWSSDATTVVVSARWGWPSVPAGVVEACLLLAADSLKSEDAPFGVAGFGDYVVRIRANPKVQEKLAPYVRNPVKVA